MNLNNFLKSDKEKVTRKLAAAHFLLNELLPDEIEDNNFEECIDLCLSAAEMFKDIKRMHHPEQVVQLHGIATQFVSKGLDVSIVKRPIYES
ncbi:YqaH family protein [Bacillus inaquosorum]|uniref:YqaH family protein n=1 Tax=Bacillus inaquosorum TaxID=483913 RepID=UPI002E20FF57|nr:YqaH family protein [Bacillus inaquosorum]MED1540913.1 YqaH family protein [Bacillus inaquosorum]